MSKFNKVKILLLGPNPDQQYSGGVISHMRIIKSLNTFSRASLFDPGSIDKLFSIKTCKILLNCFSGPHRKTNKFDYILINSSIYPTALIKLLILLVSVSPSKRANISVFFHGGRFEKISYLKFRFVRKLADLLLRKVDRFYFLSDEQGKDFSLYFPELDWDFFKNFLPSNKTFHTLQENKKSIIFVGRMVKDKGIYEIISAINEIVSSNMLNDYKFVFAGDGPELDNLRKKADRAGLKCVQFMGQLSPEELDTEYAKAYMLVLPSYHEGLPYVILEAIRAGLPIITTATGAIKEVIKHEVNGLIVPKQDYISLAESITRLSEDKALCKTMSKNNYELYINCFSKNAAERFYSRILDFEHL